MPSILALQKFMMTDHLKLYSSEIVNNLPPEPATQTCDVDDQGRLAELLVKNVTCHGP